MAPRLTARPAVPFTAADIGSWKYAPVDSDWEAARWYDRLHDGGVIHGTTNVFGRMDKTPPSTSYFGTLTIDANGDVSGDKPGLSIPAGAVTKTVSGGVTTVVLDVLTWRTIVLGPTVDPKKLIVKGKTWTMNPNADMANTAAAYSATADSNLGTLEVHDCTPFLTDFYSFGSGHQNPAFRFDNCDRLDQATPYMDGFLVDGYTHDGTKFGGGCRNAQFRHGTIAPHPYLNEWIRTNGNIHSDSCQVFRAQNDYGDATWQNVLFLKGQHTSIYMERPEKVTPGVTMQGDWKPDRTYVGDVDPAPVKTGNRPSDGVLYKGRFYYSLQNGNVGHQPDTSPAWWIVAAAADLFGEYCVCHGQNTAVQNGTNLPINGLKRSVIARSFDGAPIIGTTAKMPVLDVLNAWGDDGTPTPGTADTDPSGGPPPPPPPPPDTNGLATSLTLATSTSLATSGGSDRGDPGPPPPPPPPPGDAPIPPTASPLPGAYRFVVCDALGQEVGEALDAQARELRCYRNGVDTARLVLSLDDRLAPNVFPSKAPRLKVFRLPSDDERAADPAAPAVLEFYGEAKPEAIKVDSQNGTIEATFSDPLETLKKRYSNGETFTQVDEGLVAWGLVNAQNLRPSGETWIRLGGVTTGTLRDRTYERRPVYDLLDELSKVNGGPDFDLEPVDGWRQSRSRVMGSLRVYKRQGVDRPDVHFVFGEGLPSNVAGVGVSYLPVVTQATVIGAQTADGLPVVGTYSKASTSVYGLVEAVESDPDVSTQDTVDEKAASIVDGAVAPKEVVEVNSPTAEAPRPFEHYRLGDTVYVTVKRGAFIFTKRPLRVDAIELTLDANGGLAVHLTTSE